MGYTKQEDEISDYKALLDNLNLLKDNLNNNEHDIALKRISYIILYHSQHIDVFSYIKDCILKKNYSLAKKKINELIL